MGIKHMRKIEVLLKNNSRPYTKSEIRDEIRTGIVVAKEAIDYMVEKVLLTATKDKKGITRYTWK